MISNQYFKKISTSDPKPTKNPLPYYQQVWSQYYYFSQPAQIQKILTKKPVEEEFKYNNQGLEKLNQYEDSLWVNARNKPPKKLMMIKIYKEAYELEKKQKYQAAKELYAKALKKVKAKYGQNSYLAFLVEINIFCLDLYDKPKEEMIPKLEELKVELERRNMLNNLFGTEILDYLGMFYMQINDLEKNAEAIRLAFRIRKRFLRTPSIELARHQYMASLSYVMQQQIDASAKCLEVAIKEAFNSKEEVDDDFVTQMNMVCNQLCLVRRGEQKNEEAMEILQRFEAFLKEKNYSQDLMSLNIKLQMGQQQKHCQNFQEAIVLFKEGLEIAQKSVGEVSEMAELLHELSDCQIVTEDYSSALENIRKAIQIETKVAGEQSLSLPDMYFKLGQALVPPGQIEEAKKALNKGVEIAKKIYSQDNPVFQSYITEYQFFMSNIEKFAQ